MYFVVSLVNFPKGNLLISKRVNAHLLLCHDELYIQYQAQSVFSTKYDFR